MSFVHLHTHSQFSVGDGHSTIDAYVSRAKQLGQPALALTDHGTIAGVLQFYRKAKAEGIKPIIGCELYVDLKSNPEQRNRYPDHLTVLAKDLRGYRDLIKVCTAAAENFYYRPRVPLQFLFEKGLMKHWVVLSGCMSGTIPRLLLNGEQEAAEILIRGFQEATGGFFLELMEHPIPADPKTSDLAFQERELFLRELLKIVGDDLGLSAVFTNDCHYATPETEAIHQGWLRTLSEESHLRYFDGSGYYLKAENELPFGYDNAKTNTMVVADICQDYSIPEIDNPKWHVPSICDNVEGQIRAITAPKLVGEGMGVYLERFKREMAVLSSAPHIMNSYMIAYDLIQWCREQGIATFCRGSMAGSLVSWLLGITWDDPIKFGLMFERAVNPARPTIPDFDIDVASSRRQEVLAYLRAKYPVSAPICTYSTYSPRGATRHIFSGEGVLPAEVNRRAHRIPEEWDVPYEEEPNLAALVATFRGLSSSASIHPAGFILSDKERPLTKEVPMTWVASSSTLGTQYDMYTMKALEFFKLDVLGLKALDQLNAMARFSGGVAPPENYDDPKVIELFDKGFLAEIFQFDGMAAASVTAELGVKTFDDLVAINALARPGAAAGISAFKSGNSELIERYPPLGTVLGPTRGVFLYQEQAMEACKILADFDDAEQDDVKEATKYFRAEVFAAMEPKFLHRCGNNGWFGQDVWDAIKAYSGYAFNKAHATSYAGMAYRMMWYKAYHPAAYYAAVLDDSDNRARLVMESIALKVQWALPDVNLSDFETKIEGNLIRLGLGMLKGLGRQAYNAIRSIRPIVDKDDLLKRVEKRKCNTKIVRILEEAGALGNQPSAGKARELYGFSPGLLNGEILQQICVSRKHKLSGFLGNVYERVISSNGAWNGRKAATLVITGPGFSRRVNLDPFQWEKMREHIDEIQALQFEGDWDAERKLFNPKHAAIIDVSFGG